MLLKVMEEIFIMSKKTIAKRDIKYQKKLKLEKFKRRASIEPIIKHLKSDHRMARNYLKGFIGDEINLLLEASAFNLKKYKRAKCPWFNTLF
jgi:IS5 family transposase